MQNVINYKQQHKQLNWNCLLGVVGVQRMDGWKLHDNWQRAMRWRDIFHFWFASFVQHEASSSTTSHLVNRFRFAPWPHESLVVWDFGDAVNHRSLWGFKGQQFLTENLHFRATIYVRMHRPKSAMIIIYMQHKMLCINPCPEICTKLHQTFIFCDESNFSFVTSWLLVRMTNVVTIWEFGSPWRFPSNTKESNFLFRNNQE